MNHTYLINRPWSSVGTLASGGVWQLLIKINTELNYDWLRLCRWHYSLFWMVSENTLLNFNWLNWMEADLTALMSQLIDIEFSYDLVAIDFNQLGHWRVTWPIGSWLTGNWHSYHQSQFGVLHQCSWCSNRSLSNIHNFPHAALIHLWPIGICNQHVIMSVAIDFNPIDISRHFTDAISTVISI